jgi:hypothetical protein
MIQRTLECAEDLGLARLGRLNTDVAFDFKEGSQGR